ncbi:TPA: pilin [Pseudomonas aeruginosa]
MITLTRTDAGSWACTSTQDEMFIPKGCKAP